MQTSQRLKGKIIAVFVGGTLLALTAAFAVWYFQSRIAGRPIEPESVSSQAEKMNEMPGMQMGSQGSSARPDQIAVKISPARRQLIGVKTDVVQDRTLETVIRTVGMVTYDERRIRQINLRISGWITQLFVDYTGKSVSKGDPLFALYSPDLISTQEEYLLARQTLDRVKASSTVHIQRATQAQVESARNRLLFWNLTEEQIAELERRGRPQVNTMIYSTVDGVVTKKMALQGMYVTPETNLYEITDLSTVWIYADIYEYEIPWVRVGQEAAVTLTSYPGEVFHGRVVYLYPYLNTETRTVKIRIELPNPDGKLKPGMYGNVEIRGKAGKKLAVPQEAVLDSGTRKLVFVDRGQGMYEPREVKLGNKVSNLYPILSGLTLGEKVVTSATFLIDSESKLMAATSMMGMLGMGGIKMEQGKMGEMERGGMKEMKGMEGMPAMEK